VRTRALQAARGVKDGPRWGMATHRFLRESLYTLDPCGAQVHTGELAFGVLLQLLGHGGEDRAHVRLVVLLHGLRGPEITIFGC
jgi:hypothetical protein